jgi:hypothetical protein
MPEGSVEAQNSWYAVRDLSTRVARPSAFDSRVTGGDSR